MYKGTLSSFFENTFKYNIKTKDLPLDLKMPVKCEAFIFSDTGKREMEIEIETKDELIFVKSRKVFLILEIPCRVKFTLEQVTIKKISTGYLMEFVNVSSNL